MGLPLATPGTVACQDPLFMGFFRQECWDELPFPSPGYLPNSGIKPRSPTLQVDSLPLSHLGNPLISEYQVNSKVANQLINVSAAGAQQTGISSLPSCLLQCHHLPRQEVLWDGTLIFPMKSVRSGLSLTFILGQLVGKREEKGHWPLFN